MPTERFYKLAEDKKNIICQAAIDEFCRVPFEKSSINQIIQNAGISRGSFYTYFEDKKDILTYIFSDSVESLKDVWVNYLEKYNGDIFISSELLLEYIMTQARASYMFDMMKNLGFSNDLESIFQNASQKAPCGDVGKHIVRALYRKTDISGLKLDGEEKFERLFQLIFMTLMSSLGWYYKKPEDEENLKKNFHEVLEIIQHGICKEKLESNM